MRMYDLINKKKRGEALTREEIYFFSDGYVKGEIPDYQVSALLMAICLKGMNDEETLTLTQAIAESGDEVDLSRFGRLSVDKHSTGGVGDKTTLIVAPIVASLGCKVAKMSGRGLGHTGGTVDKLEAFPGYNTSLTADQFLTQVERIGIAVTGQSGNLAPSDKKLYALRDVTATVDSIPLITSSIMGKKLPSGAQSIVLDVKVGDGAFMKDIDDAVTLAEKMVTIGKMANRRTSALITNMDTPLGLAVGNTLEVIEAIEVLRGGGPSDLKEVCVALATMMVHLSLDVSQKVAGEMVCEALNSGKAYAKFKEWISAQGSDEKYAENPELLPKAKYQRDIVAQADGFVEEILAEGVGICASILGAGRKSKDDRIDFSAGVMLKKKPTDPVKRGEIVATLYTNDEGALDGATTRFYEALKISDSCPKRKPLIYKTVL